MAGQTGADGTAKRLKLNAEMASFRLLVLAFVREYINDMGASPSYGEIAAKLQSNRMRVRRAIRSLEREGLILRTPGPRGLSLPSMRDEAIRQLRELGFSVDEDVLAIRPPGVTHPPLRVPPALDYIPNHQRGDGNGEPDSATARKAVG